MSYVSTKAQSGNQTVLSINTGTISTPVWTPIYEINSADQSGATNKTDDATNLQSLAEEWISTIASSGKFSMLLNRVSSDPGQTALYASYAATPPTMMQYQIQLAKAPGQTVSGDKAVFSAIVEEFNEFQKLQSDKKIPSQVGLKISGPIVRTLGS